MSDRTRWWTSSQGKDVFAVSFGGAVVIRGTRVVDSGYDAETGYHEIYVHSYRTQSVRGMNSEIYTDRFFRYRDPADRDRDLAQIIEALSERKRDRRAIELHDTTVPFKQIHTYRTL